MRRKLHWEKIKIIENENKTKSLTETVKLCVMNNSTHKDEFDLLKLGIHFGRDILILLKLSVLIAFLLHPDLDNFFFVLLAEFQIFHFGFSIVLEWNPPSPQHTHIGAF